MQIDVLLCIRGEEQKCMYVLVDGYVKGVQTDGDGVDHRLFSQRAPGYTFGDQSLFGGSPRP
jgi:CRP-like cAMP-binding protein